MIGSILKKKREDKKISQQELADLLGISQRTYSNIESDKSNATIEQLSKLSEFLDFNLLKELKKQGLTFHQYNNEYSNVGVFQNNNSFPKELKEQYEIQINHLKEEIVFLREQLAKVNNVS